MYRFYNANAKGRFTNDCVIRAISLAENKTWNETYDELSEIAQRNGIILDSIKFMCDYGKDGVCFCKISE